MFSHIVIWSGGLLMYYIWSQGSWVSEKVNLWLKQKVCDKLVSVPNALYNLLFDWNATFIWLVGWHVILLRLVDWDASALELSFLGWVCTLSHLTYFHWITIAWVPNNMTYMCMTWKLVGMLSHRLYYVLGAPNFIG